MTDHRRHAELFAEFIVSLLQGHPLSDADPRLVIEVTEKILADLPIDARRRIEQAPERHLREVAQLVERRMYETGFRRRILAQLGQHVTSARRMAQVFCSYRHAEFPDLVRHVAERLTDRGFTVVYDKRSLRAGPFPEQLGRGVQSCDIFMLFFGRATFDSMNPHDWVRREVETALHFSKIIIPLAVDGAVMPQEKTLPQSIQPICRFNKFNFIRDRFDEEMLRLQSWIRRPL